MLELDFSKKDSLLSIKENYGSILHRHSTSHSARVRYSFLFPVLFSSAGTADPYIDASRLRGEKILFLSALHVQIGEEEKKVLTLNTLKGAPHTHARARTEPTLTAYPAHGGISFPAVHDCPAALCWSSFPIKFDQKGRHKKSWIVTKNDEY